MSSVNVVIKGSQLNQHNYWLDRKNIPSVGDLFKDDGDVVRVDQREWDAYSGVCTLHCTEHKRSMFR